MGESELLPCPFCGGEAELAGDGYLSWAACLVCRAEGACKDEEGEAKDAWNTRTLVAKMAPKAALDE